MRGIGVLLVAIALSLACGTGKDEGAPAANSEAASKGSSGAAGDPGADRYQARGRVTGVESGGKALKIHHEAIPDFKSSTGEKVGMMSMEMSFRVADGVDAGALAVGDIIEFEFVVEWDATPPIKVVKVSKLPAETELTL